MLLKVKNIKYLLLLIPLFTALYAFTSKVAKAKTGAIKIIVIDAGHGGKDPGCNGVHSKEKDISLSVALKLGKLIEANMKDVILPKGKKINLIPAYTIADVLKNAMA